MRTARTFFGGALLLCLALCLVLGTNKTAQAQFYNGGLDPWGGGFWNAPAFGVGGSLYGSGYIPVPPYHAIHPPVYYSGRIYRPYGDSPFAYSAERFRGSHSYSIANASQRIMYDEPKPELIINPFVNAAPASNVEIPTPLPPATVPSAPATPRATSPLPLRAPTPELPAPSPAAGPTLTPMPSKSELPPPVGTPTKVDETPVPESPDAENSDAKSNRKSAANPNFNTPAKFDAAALAAKNGWTVAPLLKIVVNPFVTVGQGQDPRMAGIKNGTMSPGR